MRIQLTVAPLISRCTAPLFGHENHLSSAASIDRGATDFRSWSEVGTINADLQVGNSGQFVTPKMTAPAARSRSTKTASRAAT